MTVFRYCHSPDQSRCALWAVASGSDAGMLQVVGANDVVIDQASYSAVANVRALQRLVADSSARG